MMIHFGKVRATIGTWIPPILPIVLIAAALTAWTAVAKAQTDSAVILDVKGPITPATVTYLERGLGMAAARDAEVVIVLLDTPGGLLDSTQDIIQLFRAAEMPIAVYVTPRGAQAASAGSLIMMAGHIAAMAPETVIGAASPVGENGADLDETIFRKVSEDLKATVRNLTADRSQEATTLAEAMIDDARAVTALEAHDSGLIDIVAQDVDDLLQQMDGRAVTINDSSRTLKSVPLDQEAVPPSAIESLLLALANPVLLGILLTLGLQAILIELSSPGGWVAGLVGVLAIGLALYGLGQLPVNWFGLGLIVLAFVLFVMEVKATTHGALAITGTALLIGGLLVLFNSPPAPRFLAISVPAVLAISAVTALFFIFILGKALGAQRAQATTGVEGLLGRSGPVRTSFSSDTLKAPYSGLVLVAGELWRAEADEEIEQGAEIVVLDIDGFTLTVQRLGK